jgi:hypothetical protein
MNKAMRVAFLTRGRNKGEDGTLLGFYGTLHPPFLYPPFFYTGALVLKE